MVGRGTRKYPGKDDCIIIDFTDKSHDVCALPSLLGLNIKDGKSVIEEIEEEEKEKRGRSGRVKEIGVLEEFDLLGKSKFRWTFYGKDWRLPIGPGEYASLIPGAGNMFSAFLIKKGEKPEILYESPLDLGYAQGICEDFARKSGGSFASKTAKWRKTPPTDKQIEWLKKIGVNHEGMTKGEASDALDNYFASKARQKVGR
jgi:hypothetical protein